MILFELPWLETALILPLVGSLLVLLKPDVRSSYWWCLGFAGATLGCSLMAAVRFYIGQHSAVVIGGAFEWNGQPIFAIDELNALLLPLVASPPFIDGTNNCTNENGAVLFCWPVMQRSNSIDGIRMCCPVASHWIACS